MQKNTASLKSTPGAIFILIFGIKSELLQRTEEERKKATTNTDLSKVTYAAPPKNTILVQKLLSSGLRELFKIFKSINCLMEKLYYDYS